MSAATKAVAKAEAARREGNAPDALKAILSKVGDADKISNLADSCVRKQTRRRQRASRAASSQQRARRFGKHLL